MSVQLVILSAVSLAASLALGAPLAQADELSPFRASNLSPPSAIIGLPLWSEVTRRGTVGFTTELANHYRLSQRGSDTLVLDGETLRLRVYAEMPFGEHWSAGVDIPYLHQSGGVLDDLIDAWHSGFRLPDGARNLRPEGVLEFALGDSEGQFVQLSESVGAIGDIQISLARRLGTEAAWSLRGAVKLPSGRESALAGSGGTDWSVSALRVARSSFRGRSASVFFGGAAIAVEQPSRVRFATEQRAVAGVFGGALALGERFGIKGQLDVYSALYDSELVELGQTAVQATIGGWLTFGRDSVLEYAISEDIQVNTAPDVVLFLGMHWQLP